MPWVAFFTYLAQGFICLLALAVVAAVFSGIREAERKRRNDES